MKNRNWLNVAEYLFLIGSGVGTVATAVSQQIFFVAAPVSMLFLLNLISRRRLEETTQEHTVVSVSRVEKKLSGDISSLQKQVQALPSFLDLASLRKSVSNTNQESIAELSRDLAALKKEVAKPEWRAVHQLVRRLQEQYSGLSNSVEAVTKQLSHLSMPNSKVDSLDHDLNQLRSDLSNLRVQIDRLHDEQQTHNPRLLQDQINHINRRLNQLPQPFDASSLKQDVNSLVKVMGDMASRRELSRLVAQIEKLTQQNVSLEQSVTPLKVATTILRKQLETISTKLSTAESSDPSFVTGLTGVDAQLIGELNATVSALEQRLNHISVGSVDADVRSQVETLVMTHLDPLQQQLGAVQQTAQILDRQQKDLRDWVNRLPQLLDGSALQQQLRELAARVETTETNQANLHDEVQNQVEAEIDRRLGAVMEQIQANRSVPAYELVFDVKGARSPQIANGCGSRAMIEAALDDAQARLIIVYPFPTPETLNTELIQRFKAFLDRSGCLDIGWGHLGHFDAVHLPRAIHRRRVIDPSEKGFLYDTLNQLMLLKKQYPEQFRFKVLGTDENFLVCDRSFAILGAQSIATASAVFPQAAVGLRTTDADVIQDLVNRFDDPVLDEHDANAYFNRAMTRYDLGDEQGAIADYTEVLRIRPDQDVAANNRGLVRYDLGDRHGAIADFELAIQLNPDSYIAYCNRGYVRSELGDKLGAIEDYTFALQINPDYSTAYFYRGLARTRLQNKLGAIEDYTEVIRLDPQDATAYFYRGLACIKIGQRMEAIKDLRFAAHLFLEQGDTANYQQTLQTIEKLHKSMVLPANQSLVSNGA